MSYLDKNLEVMKEYRENIYNEIVKELQVYDIDNNIDLVKTDENIDTIIIEKDNYFYRLNSIYKPLSEADVWAESLNLKDIRKVIILFGFGNGLYINKLLDRLSNDDVILVYEPSINILKFTLKHFDIIKILAEKRVFITIKDFNEIDFKKALEIMITWDNVFSQRTYSLPQYDNMFRAEFNKFLDLIKYNNDRVIMMRNTEARFGKVCVENTFANLKYLNNCNILDDYTNVFNEDMTAIIVAAGPSLKKNITELKCAKNKSVIFAVDRALEYLFDKSISPDFAVTVDPLKLESCFAEEYEVNIPLFAELHSNKKILDKHKGKKIFYNAFSYINFFMKDFDKYIMNKLPIGTSVATATFSLCINMNFKKIILVGQDLAYGDDGTTHAGDAVSEEVNFNSIYVDGYNGNKVKTRNDWYDFLKWFESMIELYPDVEVINATEGGANIKGAKNMKLVDAINQFCTQDIDCKQITDNIKPTYSNTELDLLQKHMKESRYDLSEIKKLSEKAVEYCDMSIDLCKNKGKDCMKFSKELSDINEKINISPTYGLIDSFITEATSDIMGEINIVKEDEFEDYLSTFEKSKFIYEQIVAATGEIDNVLEEYIS